MIKIMHSIFPLDNTTCILCGVQVRPVGWSVKHSNTMVSTPVTSSFGSVDRCHVLLEKEISISVKLVNILYRCLNNMLSK